VADIFPKSRADPNASHRPIDYGDAEKSKPDGDCFQDYMLSPSCSRNQHPSTQPQRITPPDAVKSGSVFSLENTHNPDYPVFIYHQTFLKDWTDGPGITTRALVQAVFHGESFERQG